MSTDLAVTVRTLDNLAAEARVGRHVLVIDEPTSLGGDDRGPNPDEVLLSALGACTVITLEMYARRKGWPVEGVDVVLSHKRVKREDCVDCDPDDTRPYVDRIERDVKIRGPLDAEQLSRLQSIADKCPIHRVLTGNPLVVTTFGPA